MTRHRCFFIMLLDFAFSVSPFGVFCFNITLRRWCDRVRTDTGMAWFLCNDEILEDPVGPARARRRSVFRPRVNLEWPVPELFRQAMCHVHVLIDRHVPRPKIRIQDPQDPAIKYNVKIQDLHDPMAKSLSQDPRSPGSHGQTKI